MHSLEILAALTAFLLILGLWESISFRRIVRRIPIRIHVNGTRGKSSVVRLIAAGLREGGKITAAKTTGTLARFIMPDGRELPVFRPARANILEQLRIVRVAANEGAEALVIECMALQPSLQWLSQDKIVHATHGVITNARPDHLDVMGPGPDDVALALCAIIPPHGKFFTAERERLSILQECAKDREAELLAVTEDDVAQVTEDELSHFCYTEHAENVALALKVCTSVGVERATALRGMWGAMPDPGAMTTHTVHFFGRRLVFVNAFAANDPQSTGYLWNLVREQNPDVKHTIALFNCRADRPDRSRQLGEACASWAHPDHVVLMGSGGYNFARAAIRCGFNSNAINYAEDQSVPELFETLIGFAEEDTLIVGMGNIGGQGLEVVRYFKNRSQREPAKKIVSSNSVDDVSNVKSSASSDVNVLSTDKSSSSADVDSESKVGNAQSTKTDSVSQIQNSQSNEVDSEHFV